MSRTADPTAKIALLRAAEEVFAAKGLASAKVEEIAHRAGLSKGAFYLHFESKEEALKQVVESFLARCASILKGPASYTDLPSDPASMLEHWLDRDVEIYEFLWQNRGILRILNGCSGPYGYLVDAFREEMRKNSEAWIDSWKRRGLVDAEVPVDVVAMLVRGAYSEMTVRMLASEKKPPIVAWVREAHSVFMRGIGTRGVVSAFERKQP